MKLTMVSIWYNGERNTVFIPLPVDNNGKVRLPEPDYFKLLGIYVPRGATFSFGA